MYYRDFNEHKKSDKTKWIISFALIFLLMVAVFALLVSVNPFCMFGHEYESGVCSTCGEICSHEKVNEDNTCKKCGLTIEVENDVPLAVDTVTGEAFVSGQAYAMTNMAFTRATAMSSTEVEGITIKANVLPEYARNKAVDWHISFVNANSAWATGKNVSDYITLSPVSDGSLECVVTCLAPFGEQIKITVTSRDNPEASSSITVDYLQTVTGIQIKIGDIVLTPGDNYIEGFVIENGKTGPGGEVKVEYVSGDVYTIPVKTDFFKDFYLTLKYSFEEYDVATGGNVVNTSNLIATKTPDNDISSITFDVGFLVEEFAPWGSCPYILEDKVYSKFDDLENMSVDFLKEIFEDKFFMRISLSVEHDDMPEHVYFNIIVDSIADISVESVSIENDNLTFGGE